MLYPPHVLRDTIAPFKYLIAQSFDCSFAIHLDLHFADLHAVSSADIIANIPDELALHLLSFLDLPDIVSCLRVSRYASLSFVVTMTDSRPRTWHRLASDNAVWRGLFARKRESGWLLDLRRLRSPSVAASQLLPSSQTLTKSGITSKPGPLEVDWRHLYQSRAELDRRWSANPYVGSISEDKENAKVWEPRTRRMVGHTDRYVNYDITLMYACALTIFHH